MKTIIHYTGVIALILCGACEEPRESETGTAATVAADGFMAGIAEHCGQAFVYELARSGTERLFRVEFDLTTPVAEPPPAW
jgi:hypothetical protein